MEEVATEEEVDAVIEVEAGQEEIAQVVQDTVEEEAPEYEIMVEAEEETLNEEIPLFEEIIEIYSIEDQP